MKINTVQLSIQKMMNPQGWVYWNAYGFFYLFIFYSDDPHFPGNGLILYTYIYIRYRDE